MPNVAAPIFKRIIRTLADVTHYADHGDPILESCARDCADLLTRLKPRKAPAKTLPGKSRSVMRREKHQKRGDKSAAIRAAIMTRAAGFCECCGAGATEFNPLEHDHFFGGASKRSREAVETGWALTRLCHRLKSSNKPSAEHWRALFRLHLQRNHLPVPRDL